MAGKLDIRISISLPPKNYATGTERILRKVLEFSSKESRSKGPFFMGYDSLLSKYNAMRSASAQSKK